MAWFDAAGPGTAHIFRRRVVPAVVGLTLLLAMATSVHAAPTGRNKPAAAPPAAPSRGWSNPRALELAKEGIEAKRAGDLLLCLQKDRSSLALEDHPYIRLHISSCLAASGKYKDALINARDALAAGIRNDDTELTRGASTRVQELLTKIAKLKLQIPEKTEGLRITLNGQPLRPNQVQDKLSLDPGIYILIAVREEKGERYKFEEEIKLAEGEYKEIEILPKKDQLPAVTEECLHDAKNYRERLACIEEPTTRPNVHVGVAMSAYTDSTSVHVVTPALNFGVVSPTGGWSVGGSYLLDMVSAASPDLVSTASGPFVERRHAVSLAGGYKIGPAQVGAHGNVSSEPDYLSRTLGASVSTELAEKSITPRLGYSYSWDTIGYRNTPFDQFHRNLVTHNIEAGVTFVISPTTLLVTGISLGLERGENAKLYRFIPMFAGDIAGRVQPGSSAALVNEFRLSTRPREQVPQQRDRIALGARVNHRIGLGTLRVEERFYVDNWGVNASTTDGRYLHDLTGRLRVWPHARLHVQSGASFYKLAYTAKADDAGNPIAIPQFRTSDRESSPMVALTIGGGARFALTSEKATTQYAIVLSGDAMYNRYFQSLYIQGRTALWGTLGFDAEF